MAGIYAEDFSDQEHKSREDPVDIFDVRLRGHVHSVGLHRNRSEVPIQIDAFSHLHCEIHYLKLIFGRAVNWVDVPNFARNITTEDGPIILPLVLRYLTPGVC